jgi:glyoxylase-like metal-dependent hydrolase (beta-lactamase superfamily II)
LKERLLTGLLPDDLAARAVLLPDFTGPALDPFEQTHDLFGDGSILLVNQPGHHKGHIGAIVKDAKGRSLLFCADAIWNRCHIEKPARKSPIHARIAKDRLGQEKTYALLERVKNTMPELIIVPSHCPITAESLLEHSVVNKSEPERS